MFSRLRFGRFRRPLRLARSSVVPSSVVYFLGGVGAATAYYTLNRPSGPLFVGSTTKLEHLSPIEYGSSGDFDVAVDEITQIVGVDHVSISQSDIEHHSDSYYQTHHPKPGQVPRVVVYPASTEEVSEVMKVAYKYKVPIVPFTGGTSLEGQFIASRAGITLDLNRLDKIVKLNELDLDVTVQPAVGWQDLNEYLAPYGLLFGPDPGPGACIGGMVGTSCSGTNAARYGTMKENVLGLTVVLADGTIVKTKKRPRKSSAGYNLTGLFVGSEGTLGIVTEATLKLYVKPEEETVAVVNFDDIQQATNAVSDIVSKGIQVNAVELLDTNMMKCINFVKSTSKQWVEKPTLLIKIGGSKTIVGELVKSIRDITKNNGSSQFQFAQTEEEKAELWSARRMSLWSTIDWGKKTISEDVKVYITDVAVPISRLSTVIDETKQDLDSNGFKYTIIGHVGDGNFHALVLYKDEQADEAKKLVGRMVDRALENDGTCTGEHGVGVGKRQYLVQEVGEPTVDTMRRIKLALDPLRLLNADKIFQIDPTDKDH
ncbi:FAD-binding oxidoreductase CYBJADRAFT_167188 [Cyberlindnera jadinii NRRL Y-1542]|uniref:D-lactate dehydrogenase (cytochrome) n=1 Tax=Cyberlindnera jadinii (strain ATCC 18201 / CBS 1600 / BCRC 20928 / JCM 3617 / NBRC 0987 / NRRL Y-1542) TaxID=983966 RepID=A0A1E4S4T8_CYBJN|nr:hypothetical protein CYBJADRAFT_167188 [Cyberlindnera jadinii NRRL Y-1542]ODV74539.1 hypothetical protein CYBJADRAFT_167188 [Cyberlindnera jadinii NRRL Y-1542]